MFSLVVVQSLNRVQLFATPWTIVCQASLSFTVFQSFLKLMSVESVMPSNHLFLCHPVGLVVNFCTNYTLLITEALEILIVRRVSLPKFTHTVLITL